VTGAQPRRPAATCSVIVAGHICLDIIPQLPAGLYRQAPRPGALDLIGPVTLAVGGCVGNTGIALRRLGLRPTLVARVGDDRLGKVLSDLVRHAVPGKAARLVRTPNQMTSYSLVFNLPGRDRSIQHFAGVNDTFVADDVPAELLRDAALLHVGYPPLMGALVAEGGQELRRLLARARASQVTTSLDMANANLDGRTGRVRWHELLETVLPDVDVFMPSRAEAGHLLRRRVRTDGGGAPSLASVARLADEMIRLGVGVAGVKLGEHGLYIRTASPARLAAGSVRLPSTWAERELYSSVFESDVVGTAGAGDATIAGFLFGMLTGMSPTDAITTACAVGGYSTEAADGTSSVPGWPEIQRRLRHGWRRRAASPGDGWSPSRAGGLWYVPRDAIGAP
jgi:sugar/nucleoside kinase (ribokinase family)